MFTSELESGIAFINIQSDCDPLTAGQGGPKGFCAGEPQMCDVTDVRSKVPTDWSKFSPPQDVHFLAHFCFDRNQITLSICGDTSFLPSFLRSNVIFKAISHISGSKK